MSAFISCIVPVYNGERFLAEALESILAQTLPPREIIIVDDGSTDRTAEVAAAYGDHVIYRRQENAGPASARNHGVGIAKGDFLSFLDADDLWHVDKLARQMQVLAQNPTAGFCVTYLQNFWTEELADERERLRDHRFAKPMPGYVCQCLLARRSAFDLVGLFDDTKCQGEDTDWFLRADLAGVVKEILREPLVRRRIHGKNISYQLYGPTQARADVLDILHKHLKQRRGRAS